MSNYLHLAGAGQPVAQAAIGHARDLLRMRASGRIFPGINDDYLADNSGSLRVVMSC